MLQFPSISINLHHSASAHHSEATPHQSLPMKSPSQFPSFPSFEGHSPAAMRTAVARQCRLRNSILPRQIRAHAQVYALRVCMGASAQGNGERVEKNRRRVRLSICTGVLSGLMFDSSWLSHVNISRYVTTSHSLRYFKYLASSIVMSNEAHQSSPYSFLSSTPCP